MALLIACHSQGSPVIQEQSTYSTSSGDDSFRQEEENMRLTINEQRISVDWADNPTVQALYHRVKNQPIEISVRDYASMEKVGELPETFSSSNEQMTTEAGDITLYNGRNLAFYYEPNNYSLTPIGKIQGMTKDEIRNMLTSQNELTVRLSVID